ncbi:penicillin-binding protein activator [Thalassotalea marina]|uniref:Penicillin-binding protein activator n=1 Tax=Thalassotalea marina TaxID=1673741 RepID=A0A919BPJ9_9GAMM|nr:penicillin-binding protein activator [Thalassotalea marina]GHG04694.1 penicillin-binding protein activator [Thalassotalea marina]
MNYQGFLTSSVRYFCAVTIIVTLASCSSSPKKVTNKTYSKQPSVVDSSSAQTADDYLALAQQASPNESVALILKAIPLLVTQGEHKKALWLARQSKVLTEHTDEQYQLSIFIAESLLHLQLYQEAYNALVKSQDYLPSKGKNSAAYYHVLSDVQSARGLSIEALNAQLHALNFAPKTDYIAQASNVWQLLNQLSQWEIDELEALKPPYFNGWKQLLNFAHRFGHQPDTFMRYLAQWQREFSAHPANVILGQLTTINNNAEQQEQNIAVLLPLSGQRRTAGEAAQQGILSAYGANSDTTLHFIDTNTLDFTMLANQLSELNVDKVIGPLLKPNVDAYIADPTLYWPTLLLNLPTQGQLQTHHMVLSMNPEDEAVQAATTLSKHNYLSPIVFAQSDAISQRIADTFSKHWLLNTGRIPEVIHFEDASKITDKLKDTLELDLSEKRIAEIDQRIRQKLKTEARNRLDIDMIYIIASPMETRLLKPYIDVNISPFAHAIPVYASSRSHSDDSDKSDNRDLTGLTFTEMPWLLKSKQQNQALKALNAQIWPQRGDSLERIFAMGYDSVSLIRKFDMFKQYPYIRHYGQTGILKLDNNGVLTRSLLWGSYQRDKVEEIAMD